MGLWDDKKFRFATMKLIGRVKDYWSIIENLHLRETTLPKWNTQKEYIPQSYKEKYLSQSY